MKQSKDRGIFAILIRLSRAFDIAGRAFQALPKAISFYRGSAGLALIRVMRILAREGPSGVVRRIDILLGGRGSEARSINLYGIPQACGPNFIPKISVLVPNFNHANHLKARLDSIYSQTYSNFEVILLDDCSTDDSIQILDEYAVQHAEKTITYFNSDNSGGVFHQWRKGLTLATGELIWIAESDDTCSINFLAELARFFVNPAVMLAFARTEFIQDSPQKTIWTQEEYLADLGLSIWQAPFVKSAMDLIRLGWSAKNLIPNVSGVLFRNPVGLKLLDDPEWLNLRMCGDWMFYLSVIRGGLVGYSPKATNYYRQHNENTSVKAQSTEIYYREHEVVGRKLATLYPLSSAELSLQERILYNHWCLRQGDAKREEFLKLYSLERIKFSQRPDRRKRNIAIAVYALTAGGGETFPLFLANHLWQRGYAVTVINFQEQPTEDGVRRMLIPTIPLIDLPRIECIGMILEDLGIELVHSHHAWVDVNLATYLAAFPTIRHIVTLHGMYEMMERNQIDELLPRLEQRIDAFVYTTKKNLSGFPVEFQKKKFFVRIDNALPCKATHGSSRIELVLRNEDFVLCMVARAIPEKGWEEAIASVTWANAHSIRNIQLLLIGSGPEAERQARLHQLPFVHFLGFRPNVRDYFSISDMGFFPTRFKGESAPLVLIDCLLSGRPVLASAVGEIPYMLDSEQGLAGITFELEDWTISIERLGKLIADLANDPDKYSTLLGRVPTAAAKFDFDEMVDKYESLYNAVMDAAGLNLALVDHKHEVPK